jgi:nitroimidazol reductase NimA-like FMN-containing flavoprotein (pyridoxamine 5'-phosphate oxidase superfamily)
MTRRSTPTFRDLDAVEMDDLLGRNHVGRIAYSFQNRVDIEPIHYVYADGAFYLRTAPGSKLTTLAHTPWVAFEVDEIAGLFDWQSVVAHGSVYLLDDSGSPDERASYRVAVRRLRELVPAALGEGDPVPDRTVVLKLHPAEMTGRAART